MPTTLEELKTIAWDVLRDEYEQEDWEEAVYEIADQMVPIYTSDLLEVVSSHPNLILLPIDEAYTVEGSSVEQTIRVVIYQEIEAWLYKKASEYEEEEEDE